MNDLPFEPSFRVGNSPLLKHLCGTSCPSCGLPCRIRFKGALRPRRSWSRPRTYCSDAAGHLW